jgi:hypothetical protein
MKHTNTETHRKAEALLRKHNWSPLRQFEPKRDDAIGKGELFEMWRNDAGRVGVLHFYGDGHGCAFYSAWKDDGTWEGMEAVLSAR